MLYQGRKIIFQSLVGSHNYNLNREGSDKDYKVYLAPTFNDLYHGVKFAEQTVGSEFDMDYHDIRQLPELMFKANINFVEAIHSDEILVHEESKFLVAEIIQMKDKISRMNIPYLFEACRGMHTRKMAMLEKGTEGTKHLVDKYGYDTKQALHADRVLDFLQRFYDNDFTDFKKAITYEDGSDAKLHLLGIKDGEYSLRDFRLYAQDKLAEIMELKDEYKKHPVDEETNNELKELVKAIVKTNLRL